MIRLPVVASDKLHNQDVQFYREASDVQFDETGNRKRKYRYGDEDEIEMEQQERKRRQMLNKEFKSFSERITEAAVNAVRNSRHLSLCLLTSNPPDWRPTRA
jgi:nucleosome binding factor SPN SPT16 subunit